MLPPQELVDLVKAYNSNTDEELLRRAYDFGAHAHRHQKRHDGSPYFSHPLEVARILTGFRLDDATLVTALLHDTVEDTGVTLEDISREFGVEVAQLVDGVTKLPKHVAGSGEAAQAENFRKLLTIMARDVRVLLVKLADRLHNMRTIQHLREEKRERIARETMEIYAPLAGRMGIQTLREELEDLCFAVLNPEGRHSVMRRFVTLKKETGDIIPVIVGDLTALMEKHGIEAQVSGREKRPFAIWRKMESKRINFEQLSDIIGFRIITTTPADCYRALGAVHLTWPMVPERFKDYISAPKPNGYRSIHTTVMARGARVEIQLRTQAMHDVAEVGVAAHWAYKDGVRSENPFSVDPFHWLRRLVKDFDDTARPDEFLEHTKLEMLFDQIFCYTPKGRLIGLPLNATVLDFAYKVHTSIGNSCVGAKVDGRRAPIWSKVRNGQTIEILRSEGQRPAAAWLDMVVTGGAKAAIRRALREGNREEAQRVGHHLLSQTFERHNVALTTRALEIAARKLEQPDAEHLVIDVGLGSKSARQVLLAVYPELAVEGTGRTGDAPPARATMNDIADVIPVGTQNPSLSRTDARRHATTAANQKPGRYATCCHPIPGDRIVGITDDSNALVIHTIDCPVLESLENAMERWVDVRWRPEASERAVHIARIGLNLANEPGTLGTICTLIGKSGANIDNLAITKRGEDYFKVGLDVEVRDTKHLSNLMTALDAQSIVNDVVRVRALTESANIRSEWN